MFFKNVLTNLIPMCGIGGAFSHRLNIDQIEDWVDQERLVHRGKDDRKSLRLDNGYLCHNLHAMTGHRTQQPIENEGLLTADCEIYNWKELNKEYGISSRTDAETVLKLLDILYEEHHGNFVHVLQTLRKKLDGVFAFAYYREGKLILMRDLLGVKPLWYDINGEGIAFASEGKAIRSMNKRELHPRHAIVYDTETGEHQDVYLSWNPVLGSKENLSEEELFQLLVTSVEKRTRGFNKVALLFSGGFDSTMLAIVLKHLGKRVFGYVSGLSNSKDVALAKDVADTLGIELRPVLIDREDLDNVVRRVVYATESCDPIKIGVGIPIYVASGSAAGDGFRMIISGNGGDDVFAGYQRHLKTLDYGHDINRELLSGLRSLYERDLYRDDTVTMSHPIELRLPMLDMQLITSVLRDDPTKKLACGKKTLLKRLLDHLIEEGVVDRVRPVRRAAQYGSRVNDELTRLAKRKGYRSQREYFRSVQKGYGFANTSLGFLFSGGKDSALAAWMMYRRGYPLRCAIVMVSKNPESYMFHVPNIQRAPQIAKRMGFPSIVVETLGRKEEELKDLEKALRIAITKHNIRGIVSGAIASVYQRNRIEEITERVGIKMYTPLWYMDQEEELRLLFREGFEFTIVNPTIPELKRFEGKKITPADIELFKGLGINPAGEGGEYESLVLRTPFENRTDSEPNTEPCE